MRQVDTENRLVTQPKAVLSEPGCLGAALLNSVKRASSTRKRDNFADRCSPHTPGPPPPPPSPPHNGLLYEQLPLISMPPPTGKPTPSPTS